MAVVQYTGRLVPKHTVTLLSGSMSKARLALVYSTVCSLNSTVFAYV